ncbi:MAG: hypothetical protein P3T54_05640 [Dehalogenimonas sp.]|uniref:TIGR04086 family membrane protein n=1 Tax=Candidatus Dehalogenimonas loeffleri TaxID=3127115 RepID=A0ABZ2J4P7_9CHLR|nr:hypothetical protein [Dehalogenimonas sp.]
MNGNDRLKLKMQFLKSTILGAVGFGLGGFIGARLFSGALMLIPVLMGAFGGIALGISLKITKRQLASLAFWGASGFIIVYFTMILPLYVLLTSIGFESFSDRFGTETWHMFFLGAAIGAGTGAALGMVLDGKRLAVRLAIAGLLGFGIAQFVTAPLYSGLTPMYVLGWSLTGIFGGSCLGMVVKS